MALTASDKEIRLGLEKVKKGAPFISSISVQEYIEYANSQGWEARFFPALDSGFIVYKDDVVSLISKESDTILFLDMGWL